ncbi:MAG: hypothetical protein SF187_02810 [Deltaproteobacteria bacterium]|nr:hypothetical protein [Deltaproteobacteria bacterium]
MDVSLPIPRPAPRLPLHVAAVALVVFAAGTPLGLFRLGDAAVFSSAVTGRHSAAWAPPVFDVWSLALGRLALALPFGALPARLALVSNVFAAVALGLWVRVGLELAGLLRPLPRARLTAKDRQHEPVAVVGAVALVGLSMPLFAVASQPGGGAVLLALVAGWVWSASVLLRDPNAPRPALFAAALAGLVIGSAPALGVLVVPPTLVIWGWGLKRKARWALLMPFAYAVGAGVLVACAAWGRGPLSHFAGWWRALSLADLRDATVDPQAWWQGVVALADHLGVVGGLLVVFGFVTMVWRHPGLAAVVFYSLWATMLMNARVATDAAWDGKWLLSAWMGVAVVPLVAGLLHFAGKLGRAKLPGTIALVVMGAVAPMLSGGWARWRPDVRLADHLLLKAEWALPVHSSVDPGSLPLRQVFEYGSALGVRPDLSPRESHAAKN